VIIGGLGALVAWWYQDWSIAIIVFAIAGLYAWFQYFMATRQTLALSGAREIQKPTTRALWVVGTSRHRRTPDGRRVHHHDPAPNASRPGATRARVVAATTGLLEIMDDSELEGRHGPRDGLLRTMTSASRSCLRPGHRDRPRRRHHLRMIFWGGRSPTATSADRRSSSCWQSSRRGDPRNYCGCRGAGGGVRQREYLADAESSLTTRIPESSRSALEKLGQFGRPGPHQHEHVAPVDQRSEPSRFPGRLFSTHPPLADPDRPPAHNATKF